jgi:hypothetical protein
VAAQLTASQEGLSSVSEGCSMLRAGDDGRARGVRATVMEGGQDRKERLRVDWCLACSELVPH